MTLTLETALADLPAKLRVHELAKRLGATSKQMLAALNERGLPISSASASVPREVAILVIEQHLGNPEPGDEDDLPPTAGEVGAPDVPVPLFLPPTDATSTPVDESDVDRAEPVQATPTKRSRRRRGRSAVRKDNGDAADTAEGAPEPGAPEEIDEPETEDATGPAGDTAEPDEPSDGAGRRRRRRGRRGRGRAVDADDQPDLDEDGDRVEPADATKPVDVAEPAEVTEPAEAAEATATGEDEDAAEAAESEEDTASGSSRRRRRRRRRTSGEDTAPREDDPDNTVVHVRDPRSPAEQVQGVRGSTRLEAKRQRRRDSRESSRRRPQILTEAEFLARRESVQRVMAVRQRGDLAQVALLEDGILVEHFVSQTGADSLIGSVFLGKVQNVLPSMEAAFVDIGRGRNAVIYAGEVNWDAAGLGGKARRIESALTSGDTILAQVSKDPVGHKGARLTTQISLPGRFLVYVPGGGATGISRKLPDTERKRLKSILDRIVPQDAGVIIRTAAEGVSEEELARDVERLRTQWEEISRRAEAKGSAPTLLYAEPGTLIKVVRDLFNSDISRLIVDGDADEDKAWGPVSEYVEAVAPELADRLVRWEHEGNDVFANYRVDEQIAKALERKVHLPSGGSLIIDRTEAMTVVDVNTGKYTGSGGNLEETVTKNNLEAAEEIVRQLRLRDIGGIIVIDFIDMVLESNRELVLRRLTEALGRDRTRHQVAEVTSLGLVQMTRKRLGTGLLEAFSEPCPHCGGRGIVLNDMPVATAPEQAPASERRGKGRRRVRDGGRVEEVVIPRVELAPARRPDPRGPKPPALPGVQSSDRLDPDGPAPADSDDGTDLAAAVAEAAAVVTEPIATEPIDEAGEPIDVEPAPVAVESTVVVVDAEPRVRRRRAAGRPAGAPSAAAAVDIVVAEAADDEDGAAADRVSGGYLVTDDGDAGPRQARRAASRPAGPSGGDGETAVVTVAVES